MDVCGRCKSSKLRSTASDNIANFRKKRDLRRIMKRAAESSEEMAKQECPCPIREEKDACGVCNPKKRLGTSSNGKPNY